MSLLSVLLKRPQDLLEWPWSGSVSGDTNPDSAKYLLLTASTSPLSFGTVLSWALKQGGIECAVVKRLRNEKWSSLRRAWLPGFHLRWNGPHLLP